MTYLRLVRASAAASLLLIVAACARTGGAADAGGSGGSAGHQTDALVLRVEYTGGFVTPAMLASRLPVVSVYGDGRVITEGPQILSYPPPALPNVQVQQIEPTEVQTLVDRAIEAGIGGPPFDYGQPPIADAPSTRFTLITDEASDVVEVYALGETPTDGHGLTEEQVQARQALRDLLDALTDLPRTLGDDAVGETEPYEPSAVAALASPYSPDPEFPEPPPVTWPGPTLPGEPIGPDVTCVPATGEAAAETLAAARPANALTPWISGGERWTLNLRPLLPDESGCADLRDE